MRTISEVPSYPCIPRDCKKSVKIKSEDREIIKILHDKQKWSINKIAKFFNVQSKTISMNLNPEIRKRRNQHTNDYKKKQYAEDETIRRRAIEQASKWVCVRYKKDNDYRKYRNLDNKKYRNNNSDKIRLISKKYQQDHKYEISLKASIKYYKTKLKKLQV